MKKLVLVYGSLAGAIIIGTFILGAALGEGATASLEWLGYLVMVVALSLVFVGVKQHRDRELGGVIRFGRALGVGLGIVLVASAVYVAAWEGYLAATGHAFMDQYAESVLAEQRAEGASPAELEVAREEMDVMRARYERTPFRLLITFMEIFPVGFLVALVSAAVLRNPEVLPPPVTAGGPHG